MSTYDDLLAFYRAVGAAEEIDLVEGLDAERLEAMRVAHDDAIRRIARVVFGDDEAPADPGEPVAPDGFAEDGDGAGDATASGRADEGAELSYGQVVGMLEHQLGAAELDGPDADHASEKQEDR